MPETTKNPALTYRGSFRDTDISIPVRSGAKVPDNLPMEEPIPQPVDLTSVGNTSGPRLES